MAPTTRRPPAAVRFRQPLLMALLGCWLSIASAVHATQKVALAEVAGREAAHLKAHRPEDVRRAWEAIRAIRVDDDLDPLAVQMGLEQVMAVQLRLRLLSLADMQDPLLAEVAAMSQEKRARLAELAQRVQESQQRASGESSQGSGEPSSEPASSSLSRQELRQLRAELGGQNDDHALSLEGVEERLEHYYKVERTLRERLVTRAGNHNEELEGLVVHVLSTVARRQMELHGLAAQRHTERAGAIAAQRPELAAEAAPAVRVVQPLPPTPREVYIHLVGDFRRNVSAQIRRVVAELEGAGALEDVEGLGQLPDVESAETYSRQRAIQIVERLEQALTAARAPKSFSEWLFGKWISKPRDDYMAPLDAEGAIRQIREFMRQDALHQLEDIRRKLDLLDRLDFQMIAYST